MGQNSDASIARHLNREGYRMVSKRHPNGYPFTEDTVTAMFSNPFYAGLVSYAGQGTRRRDGTATVVPGKHEPLISAELFTAVQARRAAKRGQGRHGSAQAHPYIAAGLVRCAGCQQNLRAQGAATRHPVYRDASHDRGLACVTRRKSIPESVVARDLGDAVRGLHLPDDWQARVLALATTDDERAAIAKHRAALQSKLQRLKGLLIEGDIEQREYRQEKARLETELAALQDRSRGAVDAERAAALLRHIGGLWESATPEERRTMAATLFAGVICDLDAGRVVGVELHDDLAPLCVAIRAGDDASARMSDVWRNRRDSLPHEYTRLCPRAG